jgi:uncharacterized protein with PQ loop repeat
MTEFHTNYLMNIASILYFLCYIPEAYANIHNKNANQYNIPEKVILLCGTCFALSYAIVTKNTALIFNYAPLMSLDFLMLVIRVYYAYMYKHGDTIEMIETNDMENEVYIETPTHNPIHNTESSGTFDSHSSHEYL